MLKIDIEVCFYHETNLPLTGWLDWLKALKDVKVVDIRKVYKNGVTDSVMDNYRRYLEK